MQPPTIGNQSRPTAWQVCHQSSDLAAYGRRIKLHTFIAFVIDNYIFEEVENYVRVTKFQKRELPHARSIFIFRITSKLYPPQPFFVDTILSAEISSGKTPIPCKAVLKHDIHNPCGKRNPSAKCIDDGICEIICFNGICQKNSHDESSLYVARQCSSTINSVE